MTPMPRELLIVCPFVFLAGFVDSIAGGGGIISLPAYLAAGLPAHNAIATNKLSSCCGTAVSTLNYGLGGCSDLRVGLTGAAAALVGSWLGARLTLVADEKYLRWLMMAMLPVVAGFLLLRRDLGSGNDSGRPGAGALALAAVISLALGCYDGFFGPGTGTFLALAFCGALGMSLRRATGTAKIINLASNAAALVTFALSGQVLWALGGTAALFGIAGNYLGSRMAIKKGARFIRPMMAAALALLLAKIIADMI